MIGCSDEASTGEASQGEYLFGLSEAELVSIHHLVADKHDLDGWLATNRAPFRCDNYDDLCGMVGRPAAEELTRDALFLALGGAALDEIVAESDRATALARDAYSAEDRGLARASDVDTQEYACGNHRVRTETFKVNPVFGSRYGQVTCKLQEDLGSGIWGGNDTFDEITAYVEIFGTSEDASSSQTNTHKLSSPKVYPGANQTVNGVCTGDHNGAIVVVAESIN
jgi:hypothetical protein